MMNDFKDMRQKAKLVVDTVAGCLSEEDRKRFEEAHFNLEYTRDCTVEQIVQDVQNQLASAAMLLEFEPVTEETLIVFVDSEEKDTCKKALDYLIEYGQFPYGGFLCYEMQKALHAFMAKLRETEGVEAAVAEKLKVKELGAAQQMAKSLLEAAKAMKARNEEEFVWLGVAKTREQVLREVTEIAGRCLAARTLHGNACCNVFAACAVCKCQAIAMKELGEDREAHRHFLRTLKLFKEGRGAGVDPRADKNLKDMYDAFGLNGAVGARVRSLPSLQDPTEAEVAGADVPPEGLQLCVCCQTNRAQLVYSNCRHACICVECSESPMLPGHRNPLDACPKCQLEGPRRRVP